MTAEAKIARAQRWSAFMDEPGGLRDMLAHMTAAHMREAVQCEPWDTDRLKKVALSLKLIGELQQAIQSIADSGKLADHAAREHATRVAATRERKPLW